MESHKMAGNKSKSLIVALALLVGQFFGPGRMETVRSATQSAMALAPSPAAAPSSTAADQADLGVSIVAALSTVVIPGGQMVYTMTVTNNGPDAATNVRVTFSINIVSYFAIVVGGSAPAGWSCSTAPDSRSRTCDRLAPMPVGTVEELTVDLEPQLLRVYAGSYLSAVVSSSTQDPMGANNSAHPGDVTVITSLTNADAAAEVLYYVDGRSNYITSGQPGSRVTLIHGARNGGPAIASYTSTLQVPAGAQLMSTFEYEYECVDTSSSSVCRHGNARVNGPGVYPYIYGMMLLPSGVGVHTSTVTAQSGQTDPVSINDVVNAPITVTNMITKADLRVMEAGVLSLDGTSNSVRPGAGVSYRVVVSNAGPGDGVNAEVVIPLFQNSDPEFGDSPSYAAIKFAPTGWSCGVYSWSRLVLCRTPLFTASTSAEIFVNFAAGQVSGLYEDTVWIGSDSGDPDTGNNFLTHEMKINADTSPKARLWLHATHQSGQTPIPSGTFPVTFTFTITNDGPDAAVNPQFDISWDHYGPRWDIYGINAPGWSCFHFTGYTRTYRCTRSSFPPGDVSVINYMLSAPIVSTTEDTRVCALITSETHNDYPTYYGPKAKFACDGYYVTPYRADIRVSGRDNPDPVNAGGTLTYFISVHNAGPDNLINGYYRTLDLLVAPGVSFQQIIAPPGWLAITTFDNAWNFYFPVLAAGETSTATIIVAAPSITGSIAATATVRGSDFDPNLADNTTVIRTRVSLGENAADLRPEIYPLDDFDACVATTVPIRAVTANLGPDVAANLRMTITSSGPDTLSTGVAGCTALDGFTLACTAPTLDAGQNFTALVNVTVAGIMPSTITVAASSDTPDGNGEDNVVSRVIRPIACATATPTATQTPTSAPPTATSTQTPTPTQIPTSALPTATHTATPTQTATSTATDTPPSATPTQIATATATDTPPTATATPTQTPTSTATDTPPTATPTQTPTPTGTAAASPTPTATDTPPTATPTQTPTPTGTAAASPTPTATATGSGRTPRGFLPMVLR